MSTKKETTTPSTNEEEEGGESQILVIYRNFTEAAGHPAASLFKG